MPAHQPFVGAPGSDQAHVEFRLRGTPSQRELATAVSALWDRRVGGHHNPALRPDAMTVPAVTVVVGLGPAAARLLLADAVPAGLADFAFPTDEVPATQHDVWVWLHGSAADDVYDAARAVTAALAGLADVAATAVCRVYHDGRTVEGFIDGTENPSPFEAVETAVIGEGPATGGSVVLVQRWESHRIGAFAALPVAEQERVFGRTKAESLELDPLPADSHVARNVLEVDGEELSVLRRNAPVLDIMSPGYMFVGFAADHTRTQRMLERMYGVDGGPRDRFTRFARPLSSAWYFVPSLDALAAAGAGPADEDEDD